MAKAISNLNDIVGNKYGKLTVDYYIETVYVKSNREHYYSCTCDCGKKDVRTTRHNLLRGDTTSCGCAHKDAGKSRLEDLTGKRFGRWTVLYQAPTRYSVSGKTRSIMWKCKCDCGMMKNVGARALKTGMSVSCGCYQKERVSEALTDDLTGKRFGHLIVITRNGSHCSSKDKKGGFNAVWKCKCDCGNEVDVLGFSLKNGDTTSCGCKKESKYEAYTEQYLQSCGYVRNVDYVKEKTYPDLKGLGGQSLRFDFSVNLHSGEHVLIECQGEQHYRAADWYGGEEYFKKVQAHDSIKKQFAKDNNIRLIEIDYKDVLYENIIEKLKHNGVY